jgi:predicted acyl esterase
MTRNDDVAVPMRDGIALLADVHRPAEPGRYPLLVAASPYPRQIQDLGAPAGFIEAGASDFFVPRGYVHVIANCRGTSGSGGTFGFFDSQERRDMHDLVEWAGQQPESHHANRRNIRPLRIGHASWSDEQRFPHAISLYDRHDIQSHE